MNPVQCYALDRASIPRAEITVYCVNSLLPMDLATLASQDGDPYPLDGATDFSRS